jgi:CBS domain-containing protein
MPVRDVMNRGVLTFPIDGTVSELATFLMDKEISGVPVVDGEGKLVGVVSVTDIVEQRTREHDVSLEGERGWQQSSAKDLRRLRSESDGVLVRDIMTPTVYTVPDDTPVAEVARTMIAGRIHRLFVTQHGHIVGIVTTLDLLRLLTNEAA